MSEVSQGRLKEDAERRRPHQVDPQARDQPHGQKLPLDDEETLDETRDETFPASEPAPAKRVDGPKD